MADLASALRLLFTAQILLILGLMVLNTYFVTRSPVVHHLKEIYFIHSARLKRAWYLVTAAMAVFAFVHVVDALARIQAISAPTPGLPELFLVVFATLIVLSFVELVRIFQKYIPRLGSDEATIRDRIRQDLRRHLLQEDSHTDLGDLLPSTADVYQGRGNLGPYVSIAHYRGVVLGITKYLERRYGELGDALLYAVGRQTARTVARDLLEETQDPDAALSQFMDALRTAQVGIPRVEGSDGRRRILLDECAICCGMPAAGGPECHYLTGLFAGLHEVLWSCPVQVRETRCGAAGDDHCEFEVEAVG